MPLTSTNPIVVEGKTYPYFAVNLSISPLFQTTEVGGSVALRLMPYRVKTEEEGGGFETVSDASIQISFLDVFKIAETDADVAAIATTIMGALQQFITSKNM